MKPVERDSEETRPTVYRVYATNDNGDGRVTSLGDYDDPTDIEIIVGMFSKDVIISIGEVDGR